MKYFTVITKALSIGTLISMLVMFAEGRLDISALLLLATYVLFFANKIFRKSFKN